MSAAISGCWKHMTPNNFKDRSGDACDHYNRFDEDIRLLASLGLNAYRFSIEWSRIEPASGEFSRAEIEHYRRVLIACRTHRVVPMMTLNHFTTPRWFAAAGGWGAEGRGADLFALHQAGRIRSRRSSELRHDLQRAQPQQAVAVGHGPSGRQFGGQGDDPRSGSQLRLGPVRHRALRRSAKNSGRDAGGAYRRGRGHEIRPRQVSRRHEPGDRRRSADRSRQPGRGDPGRRQSALARGGGEGRFHRRAGLYTSTGRQERLPAAARRRRADRRCTTSIIRRRWKARSAIPPNISKSRSTSPKNGVGTKDDTRRVEFLRRALPGMLACIEDGIDVRGYMHWSLLDNFEWELGYDAQFGLCAVDLVTQKRTPKPSAALLWRYRTAQRDLEHRAGQLAPALG